LKNFTFNLAKLITLFTIILFIQQENAYAQFPCGGQILSACNCDGTSVLVADSEPCTFNSDNSQQIYLLVDEANATVNGDADNGAIVDVSSNGAFFNVQTGDYVLYSLIYDQADAAQVSALAEQGDLISALIALGTEGPAGTWTSSSPSFTLVATPLATINGPECGCTSYSVGNYIWSDNDFDGVQDPSEPGIPGVTVILWEDTNGNGVIDSGDTQVAQTTSNAAGFYGFSNVGAGDYILQVDLSTLPPTDANGNPISWSPTAQGSASGNNFNNSDYNNQGLTGGFSVGAGDSDLSFDAGFRPSQVTLASELVSFEGKTTKDGNQLLWTTGREVNNDYFSVMRSENGINFDAAGTVKGAGNSNARKNYSFMDSKAPVGTSYYNLTNTDFSGKTAVISKTISLSRELGGFTLNQIHPIPATDFVNIEFASQTDANISIKVFNLSGKVMVDQNTNAQEGVNALKLDISSYAVGVYFVTISNGTDKIVGKFMKD